ncbi:MAG: hydrogenase expression/formation protein HypE [Planctomycetes bacterium]|nr:hydrogenase expression/formation protein HypE [Planctomycetota bacterium]
MRRVLPVRACRGHAGAHGVTKAAGNPVGAACPLPLPHHERIVMGHGSGGRLTADLVDRLFKPLLANPVLMEGDDSAVIGTDQLGEAGELALSTDAHVVRPLFFPGGDIGRLSICGTVNDLAMVGARPMWIAAAFIIEEGFATADLDRIVRSAAAAAQEAGVTVVAGDTKVAERGAVDGLYVTTTGVGLVPAGRPSARAARVRGGDAVLVSGPIGDHGIAVLAARGDLALRTAIESDTAPLNGLVEKLYGSGVKVHALRDPTRGGVAASLNELAASSGVCVVVEEPRIPVRREVAAACEILGFDPLHIANEGRLVAFVPETDAETALAALRSEPYGAEACRIGRVEAGPAGRVLLETGIGGTRIVDMPSGELLPRIC